MRYRGQPPASNWWLYQRRPPPPRSLEVLTASGLWPTTVDAGGRFIKDQNGNPWMMHGEAAWSLPVNLTNTEIDTYLTDRAGKGVNAVILMLFAHIQGAHAPNNIDNDSPWQGTAFQSALGSNYFARVDRAIAKAGSLGITCILSASYLGFAASEEGWDTEIEAASNAQMQSVGAELGARYKNYPNIIWLMGGDRTPSATDTDRIDHMITGIQGAGDTHFITAHPNHNHDSLDFFTTGWVTLNGEYVNDTFAISTAVTAWGRSGPLPFILLESEYEHRSPSPSSMALIRRQWWQALCTGALGGHIQGNWDLWTFGYDSGQQDSTAWQSHLNDTSIVHSQYIKTFFDNITGTYWPFLVPDLTDVFMTAGEGTGTAQAAASYSADLGVIYKPAATSTTVDMSVFTAHRTMRVRWFDPTAGTYTLVGNFSTSNTAAAIAHPGNNSAGDSDWVMVVDAAVAIAAPRRRKKWQDLILPMVRK